MQVLRKSVRDLAQSVEAVCIPKGFEVKYGVKYVDCGDYFRKVNNGIWFLTLICELKTSVVSSILVGGNSTTQCRTRQNSHME